MANVFARLFIRTTFLLTALAVGAAQATPLNEYNLILTGDLKAGSLHVYDRAFIGGNVNTSGWLEFGSRLDKSTHASALQVAGDIRAPGITVQAGYLDVGGSKGAAQVNCNGNGLNGKCVNSGANLQSKAAELGSAITADSQWFSSLSANGDVFTKGNNKTLSYSGTDSVAVFNLDGATLFSQNSNWSLQAGSAETVIINVSGSIINNSGGVNFNQGFGADANLQNLGASNILWNFYQATDVNFGSARINGSVLAADANVTSYNNIDGALAAKSYQGSGEIHNYLFNWTAPANTVPEPSTMLLMFVGLGLLGLFRLRRRKN